MRKRWYVTVLGSVALLLCSVGFLVGRSLWQQRQRDVAPSGVEFIPGVSQHIRDFHRVKLQDGRKVWEVSAQDAQYVDDEKTVVVRDAMIQLFLKDNHVIGLSGKEGRIVLDGREVSRVDLTGDIRVSLADYLVRTERATYDHSRQLISTAGAVEISGQGLRVHGDRMEAEVETQRVRLLHNVSMQMQPAAVPQGGHDAPR